MNKRPEECNFPVWETQGGGLAIQDGFTGLYIIIKAPKCSEADVGDEVPSEWDVVPANQLALEKEGWDNKPTGTVSLSLW